MFLKSQSNRIDKKPTYVHLEIPEESVLDSLNIPYLSISDRNGVNGYGEKIEIDEIKLKEKFNPNSYEIINFKVGYVGGNSNPLNHITFYDLKTNTIISQKKVRDFSLLINQKHQEHFLRVYCTDHTLLDKINSYFEYSDITDNDN